MSTVPLEPGTGRRIMHRSAAPFTLHDEQEATYGAPASLIEINGQAGRLVHCRRQDLSTRKASRLSEIGAAKVGAPQNRVGEIGGVQVSLVQVRVFQNGLMQVCVMKIGVMEICPLEVGSVKVRTVEVAPMQVGAVELAAREGGKMEIGAVKVGICQDGAAEVSLVEVAAMQICPLSALPSRGNPLAVAIKHCCELVRNC